MSKPLSPAQAKKQALLHLATGLVVFTGHARAEMLKDDIDVNEVIRVLRAGVVEPAELEHGEWRYRFRTSGIYAVVAFQSNVVVVTAWRCR